MVSEVVKSLVMERIHGIQPERCTAKILSLTPTVKSWNTAAVMPMERSHGNKACTNGKIWYVRQNTIIMINIFSYSKHIVGPRTQLRCVRLLKSMRKKGILISKRRGGHLGPISLRFGGIDRLKDVLGGGWCIFTLTRYLYLPCRLSYCQAY